MFKEFLLLILVRWGIDFTVADEYTYEITRMPEGDRFKIPSFHCTKNWTQKCASMYGTFTGTNCTCQCTDGSKNVFGYFGNSWKCISNHDMRRTYSGCSFEIFEGENDDSHLEVVDPENYDPENKIGYIGELKKDCNLKGRISFLNCDGKWQQTQNHAVGFVIYGGRSLYHYGTNKLNQYSPTIYGHVIKLKMRCYIFFTGTRQWRCVLLKTKGTQNCKIVLPTTTPPSTPTTSTTRTTALFTQTTSYSTTSSTSLSTTLSHERTKATTVTAAENLTTTSLQELTATQPIIYISSSIQRTGVTDTRTSDGITNSPRKGKSTNTDGSSSGAIAGSVGGVAALVVIVVALFVLLKRRRHTKEKRESVAPIADNQSYHNTMPDNEQSEFPDDDEYSYAYTNNHPVVIKDQNGKAFTGPNVANGHNRNINGLPGCPPNQQAPVYSTLDDPNYAKLQNSANTSNGPSYNVLARPENQWTTKQGPVYDVLEEPNTLPNKDGPIYNTLEDPKEPSYNTLERPENKWMTKQGPVYDVLEDPNSTGGPVYSVLEGPNSHDQQVYDALEGQDPNVYGSLDSPDPHVYGALYSPTSTPAYDNDIYDSAGGTIIDEDTYQELNQTDQRSSDIYQPVRPPRNTMAMKNMSGITQSQA